MSHLQEGRSGRVQFGVALNLGTRSQLQQYPCSTCLGRFCAQSRGRREDGRGEGRGGEGGRYRPRGFPSQVFRLLGLPKSLEACWSEGPEIPLTTASGAGMRPGLEPVGQGHSSRTDQRTWAVLRDSRRHWGPCLGQGGQCSPHPALAAFLMSP